MNDTVRGPLSDPGGLIYDRAAAVIDAERRHLVAWRGREPQVGLALSGGGIRSASFSLGVLQALAHEGALPNVDLLSTVSGGGYIGNSLVYLLHDARQRAAAEDLADFDATGERFPYVSFPMVSVQPPPEGSESKERLKGRLLRRLRQNANYLAPGGRITMLSLAGVLLRNILTGALVHMALMLVSLQLLWRFACLRTSSAQGQVASTGIDWPPGNVPLVVAVVALVLFLLLSLLFMLATRGFDPVATHSRGLPYGVRRVCEIGSGWLLGLALVGLAVGLLPAAYEALTHYRLLSPRRWFELAGRLFDDNGPAATGALAALLGIAGNLLGFRQARGGSKPRIPTAAILAAASGLLLFGVLLMAYALVARLNAGGDATVRVVGAALAVLLLLGLVPLANYVSLHRYYRDRLLELFLPDVEAISAAIARDGDEPSGAPSRPGDRVMLGDLCRDQPAAAEGNGAPSDAARARLRRRGPYPLINANVVLVASQHPRYRGRGGDNFILSPLFYGSRATGWTPTERAPERGFTLATAMAISGAALNPNAAPGGEGPTRQPVLSVLMGMLNLRLGYWAENPQWTKRAGAERRPAAANLIWPGLKETFGRRNLNEHEGHLLLTDGGHFENLGLYELVRRRLPLIVVCDATRDTDYAFADLANAIEKVRADFGALIELSGEDLATLVLRRASGPEGAAASPMATCGHVVVPIRYALRTGQDEHSEPDRGLLVLIKATFFEGLSADLHGYRRAHPGFPNESTGDQFFDEKQFEAYRELGFQTTFAMLTRLRDPAAGVQARRVHDLLLE